MQFIKMTKKGNVKVYDGLTVRKLYAVPAWQPAGSDSACARCLLQTTDACQPAACLHQERAELGLPEDSVVFVDEKP